MRTSVAPGTRGTGAQGARGGCSAPIALGLFGQSMRPTSKKTVVDPSSSISAVPPPPESFIGSPSQAAAVGGLQFQYCGLGRDQREYSEYGS